MILLGGDYVLFDMLLNFLVFSDVFFFFVECALMFVCFGNYDCFVGIEKNYLIGEMLKLVGIMVLFN